MCCTCVIVYYLSSERDEKGGFVYVSVCYCRCVVGDLGVVLLMGQMHAWVEVGVVGSF